MNNLDSSYIFSKGNPKIEIEDHSHDKNVKKIVQFEGEDWIQKAKDKINAQQKKKLDENFTTAIMMQETLNKFEMNESRI